MVKNVDTYRKPCRYRSLDHERNIERAEYSQNLTKLYEFQNSDSPEDMIEKDGISSLAYEKVSEENLSDKTKLIRVKL
jgi:hypothetical protein